MAKQMPKMSAVECAAKLVRTEVRTAVEEYATTGDRAKAYAAAERAQMAAFELKNLFALDLQWPTQSGKE